MARVGRINFPLELTSFAGINIPWLKFETGSSIDHDGYGNGFNDYYFSRHHLFFKQLAYQIILNEKTQHLLYRRNS